jgi:hypothetical protein
MSAANALSQLLAAVGKFASKFPDAIVSLTGLVKAVFDSDDPKAAIRRATTAAATRRIWRRPR